MVIVTSWFSKRSIFKTFCCPHDNEISADVFKFIRFDGAVFRNGLVRVDGRIKRLFWRG